MGSSGTLLERRSPETGLVRPGREPFFKIIEMLKKIREAC